MQQSPGPNAPQHGYNTQQPIQTVTAGYATQQNSPGYTTQSQQPSSGGSTPQGYSSQQVCRSSSHDWFIFCLLDHTFLSLAVSNKNMADIGICEGSDTSST